MEQLILLTSLCLQLLAAALAIALIPITRSILAWVLVAAALVLMTGRRAITLMAVTSGRGEADLSAELVALVISIAMVVGVALIRPVFTRMRDLTSDLADREQKLIRDLAERETLEAALIEAKKMEAIGRLSGGIAHDFNNLLTVIIASVSLARSMSASGRNPTTELAAIEEAAERAARLTSQLLAFARSQPISPTAFDLNALVTDTTGMLQRLVRDDVRMHIELIAETVPVIADQGQIGQVLMNLVVNACDAMPNGGELTIRTLREPGGPGQGDYGVLCVSDDGEGLSPGIKERIFEPFFTTKAAGKGTGLGLSSSYAIVTRVGGLINVDSVPGQGTTFRVQLPGAELGQAEAPLEPSASIQGGGEHILLVDDEPQLVRLAALALRERGYHVRETDSPALALAYLHDARRPADLLITDIVMPQIDGQELARRARELCPGLPILFMTGYGEHTLTPLDGDVAPQVLRKPFTPAQLHEVVRHVLDGSARASSPSTAKGTT